MKLLLSTICILYITALSGSNIQVTNINFDNTTETLSFNVTWEHSWYFSTEFRDMAYVIIKYRPNGSAWQHAEIATLNTNSQYSMNITGDSKGLYLRKAIIGVATSSVDCDVTFSNLVGNNYDFKVFGIEMVTIPTGSFYAGDGTAGYRVHEGGNPSNPYLVETQLPIPCNNTTGGYYRTGSGSNPCIDLAADFPKGYASIFMMKYHVSQQQYVDFLNTLTRVQQDSLTQADLSGPTASNNYVMSDTPSPSAGNGIYTELDIGTGPITFYCNLKTSNPPNSIDDGQSRSCNYITYREMLSFLDWACLRPMSFLEFEKASRGPLYPVANEFSWGSSINNVVNNPILNLGKEDETIADLMTTPGHVAISSVLRSGYCVPTTGGTREISQASYYGVISLGNNMGDIVVNDKATYFDQYDSGDGQLAINGKWNEPSWLFINNSEFAGKRANSVLGAISYLGPVGPNLYSSTMGFRGVRKF